MANTASAAKAKPSAPVSPARQALIEARKLHREVAQEAAAARAADEHAAGQVQAAEAALLAVRDRLDRAKKTLAAAVSGAARGGPAADAAPLSKIRVDELGALDVLEATAAARVELLAAREAAERSEVFSVERLRMATSAVIVEAMPGMMERAIAVQQELIRFRLGVRWLVTTHAMPSTPAVLRFMDREAFLPRIVGGELDNGMVADWAKLAGEAPWKAFIEALRDDPAAPLPQPAVLRSSG